MALEICKNHPGKKSIGKCETCHIPLCEECAVVSSDPKLKGRIFCSEAHRDRFEQYQGALGEKRIGKGIRQPSIFTALIKWALILAFLYLAVRFIKPELIPKSLKFF